MTDHDEPQIHQFDERDLFEILDEMDATNVRNGIPEARGDVGPFTSGEPLTVDNVVNITFIDGLPWGRPLSEWEKELPPDVYQRMALLTRVIAKRKAMSVR